ncbi:GDSL-type esterase/lipase family protein [Agromyces sp. NPDC049794]|uniref:golvesin C-terminal-like domain-containing protein n=1 Tax=Agromyces sp. NPDC049794 TaxID=3154362 RepID=UPI0033E4E910
MQTRTRVVRARKHVALLLVAALLSIPAASAQAARPDSGPNSASPDGRQAGSPGGALAPQAVPERDRDRVLARGWKTSKDVAWTTAADGRGFHILTADAAEGYRWRVVATLRESLVDVDQWIGQACLTSTGDKVVAVYAPRAFANKPDLYDRGGFTAVVDLRTGRVTKLGVTASLAYFNPGCGANDLAVLTQAKARDDQGRTRLAVVDARRGRVTGKPVELAGQVTSAIPLSRTEIVAAKGAHVVRVDDRGRAAMVARTTGVPFRLTADADGGVVFLDRVPAATPARDSSRTATSSTAGTSARDDLVALRLSREQVAQGRAPRTAATVTRPAEIARGAFGDFSLAPAARGRIAIVGAATVRGTAGHLTHVPDVAAGASASTTGAAFVHDVDWTRKRVPQIEGESAPIGLSLTVPATDETVRMGIDLAQPSAAETSPGQAAPPVAGPTTAGAKRGTGAPDTAARAPAAPAEEISPALDLASTTVSGSLVGDDLPESAAERACGVVRNDHRRQAMQPKPRQVEWAVNQAITGNLNARWNPTGVDGWRTRVELTATKPMDLFPTPAIAGWPGSRVPAQVALGIAMQESNLWQASRYAMPGITGNPLIGNYYGIDIYNDSAADDWDINMAAADCGYGVMQVTDGMRKGERTYEQQHAIALDYASNIAAGLQILVQKWNQTYSAGLRINNGDPRHIENWFYAAWAYNSGFYPQSDAAKHNGAWGVGWHNNPANPKYNPARAPFLHNNHFIDAVHPNWWPYPERVMGWAAWPMGMYEAPGVEVPAFRGAWWNTEAYRYAVKPPMDLFCDTTNRCAKELVGTYPWGPDAPEIPGPCLSTEQMTPDYRCWFNRPATWKQCSLECGYEFLRFPATWAEEANGTAYPPNCSRSATASGNAAPPGAYIVDNDANGVPSVRPCADITSNGTFSMSFATDADGTMPSKVDVHQLGAGFGGRFIFGHTRSGSPGGIQDRLEAVGTWTLDRSVNGWMRVAVHLPDHGARTQQAKYTIHLGDGRSTVRYLNQKRKANNWVSLGAFRFNGVPRVSLTNVSLDGDGTENVAWDAVAFQPLSREPVKVAVLGDSYASGEGTGDPVTTGAAGYYAETNTDGGDEKWQNSCRRSPEAWARKLVMPGMSQTVGALEDQWSSAVELGFVACSGAVSEQLTVRSYGKGQWSEYPQLYSGVVNADTDYVVLTIGGNDGDLFSNVLTTCVSLPMCQEHALWNTVYDQLDDRTIPDTEKLLRKISLQAPNAKIVLATYPTVFKIDEAEACWVEPWELNAILPLQAYFTRKQGDAVLKLWAGEGLNVSFAPVDDWFRRHDACEVLGANWINGLTTVKQGDGDAVPSMASFHPNDQGTTAYAAAISAALGAPVPNVPWNPIPPGPGQ